MDRYQETSPSDQPCDSRVDLSFQLVYFPHYETQGFISRLSKYKPLTFPTFPRCSGTLNRMTLLHCFFTTKLTAASPDLGQKKKQKIFENGKVHTKTSLYSFCPLQQESLLCVKGGSRLQDRAVTLLQICTCLLLSNTGIQTAFRSISSPALALKGVGVELFEAATQMCHLVWCKATQLFEVFYLYASHFLNPSLIVGNKALKRRHKPYEGWMFVVLGEGRVEGISCSN